MKKKKKVILSDETIESMKELAFVLEKIHNRLLKEGVDVKTDYKGFLKEMKKGKN